MQLTKLKLKIINQKKLNDLIDKHIKGVLRRSKSRMG